MRAALSALALALVFASAEAEGNAQDGQLPLLNAPSSFCTTVFCIPVNYFCTLKDSAHLQPTSRLTQPVVCSRLTPQWVVCIRSDTGAHWCLTRQFATVSNRIQTTTCSGARSGNVYPLFTHPGTLLAINQEYEREH